MKAATSLAIATTLLLLPDRARSAEPGATAPAATPQAAAETPAPPGAAEPPPLKAAPAKINYKRPTGMVGGLTVRQSGGTRGAREKLPLLMVLAPDHLALTTKAEPALFWYQSTPAKVGFQLTLSEPGKAEPLVSITLDQADKAGIRAVALREHGVTLTPGIAYQWSVALIPNPNHRSEDLLATGMIKRVPMPADLASKLAATSLAERAALYAENGLWYDALQAITSAIASDPKNPALHGLRASLLSQAGLKEAAAAEAK